jgi:hypothetical protein
VSERHRREPRRTTPPYLELIPMDMEAMRRVPRALVASGPLCSESQVWTLQVSGLRPRSARFEIPRVVFARSTASVFALRFQSTLPKPVGVRTGLSYQHWVRLVRQRDALEERSASSHGLAYASVHDSEIPADKNDSRSRALVVCAAATAQPMWHAGSLRNTPWRTAGPTGFGCSALSIEVISSSPES